MWPLLVNRNSRDVIIFVSNNLRKPSDMHTIYKHVLRSYWNIFYFGNGAKSEHTNPHRLHAKDIFSIFVRCFASKQRDGVFFSRRELHAVLAVVCLYTFAPFFTTSLFVLGDYENVNNYKSFPPTLTTNINYTVSLKMNTIHRFFVFFGRRQRIAERKRWDSKKWNHSHGSFTL